MDIVGFPVDSFAAKFILCTKTKVGNHSIPGKFGLKQTRRSLVVGSMFGGVITGKTNSSFHMATSLDEVIKPDMQ
jgi:hypothetical protein